VRFAGAFADRTPAGEARVRLWESILLEHHAGPFRQYLDRVRRYEGWIRPELARHGVPEDFLYLAVIESGLNPSAHSPMGAVGPWQFVSLTAREQGLRMTWAVDERRDPVASTAAAARYLARLRWAFGDWALAAAAYNAGPRRVGRALRRCGCDTFWELMETRLLAGETRDFVPKLIAAARIGSDPLGHGMSIVPAPMPLRFREVEVDPTSRLEAVARAAGAELAEIRRLNPHLRRDVTPARSPSRVRIPPGSAAGFRTAWSAIPEGERRAGGVHVVERRETLSGIARQHGVSVRALLAANDRLDPRRLRPGQRIRVPAGAL
jgi:membrane-bound lytic murein transglycosylase D